MFATDPLAALRERHAAIDLEIDAVTCDIEWWGEPMDLELAIEGSLPREQRQEWTVVAP